MNHEIFFRPVTERDYETILELEMESFNSYDRLDRETLIELFSEFREGFYTININDVVVGYSVFLIEDGAGYVESIAINSNYRRRGLGIRALEFMIKRMEDMKLETINLHVRMDNMAAMSLYEKNGFIKKGVIENFYKDHEPAYLYSKRIMVRSEQNSGANKA